MQLLISFALCFATALYIAAPLWKNRNAAPPRAASRDELRGQRDELLRELRELEFDRATGKVDDADYLLLRSDTAQEAAAVLTRLEQRATSASLPHLEADIEAEVLIARARRRLKTPAVWTCAACGRTMPGSDRFCGSCGTARA